MWRTPSRMLSRVFASLGLFVVLSACRERPPVVLGFALGESLLDAARMAIADETASGGLPALDTVLLLEPTSEAVPALQRARYFAGLENVVAVVGHSNSAASLAAAPVYGEERIVQMAPSTTSRLYSQSGPFSFRMVSSDVAQSQFLLETLRREFPTGARVAVFYVNDDYGRGLLDGLRPALDSAPFRVVLDMPHTDTDPRSGVREESIAAARSARADVVVWIGRVTTLNSYLPGLRAQLPGRPILSGDAVATYADIATHDGRWAGVRYVDFVDMDATPALQEFRTRYQQAFGGRASGAEVLTYDAVRLMVAAIRDGARDGIAVQRYLHSLGRERPAYVGLSGPIAFSEDGDMDRALLLVTVPSDVAR